MKALDVRRHSTPTSAYVEAADAVDAAIEAIGDIGIDCRKARWTDAEKMTGLALRLQELVREFGGHDANRT